jgi:folylpolyglutamate synthase
MSEIQRHANTSSNTLSLPRTLFFSHIAEEDGTSVLTSMAKALRERNIEIQYVIFSTYDERKDGTFRIGIFEISLLW